MSLWNVLGFGKVSLADDSDELQRVQVTEPARGQGFADRIADRVRRITEFGFTSVAPIGSDVVVVRRGGRDAQPIIIATSHRPSRLRNLKPGDTAIYDVRGAKVTLTADGLLIDCAGLPAVLQNAANLTVKTAGKVRFEATTLEVTGDVVSRADGTPVSLNGVRDAYNAHKHTGVAAGSATSGLTDHTA